MGRMGGQGWALGGARPWSPGMVSTKPSDRDQSAIGVEHSSAHLSELRFRDQALIAHAREFTKLVGPTIVGAVVLGRLRLSFLAIPGVAPPRPDVGSCSESRARLDAAKHLAAARPLLDPRVRSEGGIHGRCV